VPYGLTRPRNTRRRTTRQVCPLLLSLWALLLTARPGGAAPALHVVTTVAPLTDLVRQIGGAALDVHGLVPEGVNSHTFQPTPGDVKHLAQADVIILNGLYLEVPTEKLARRSAKSEAVFLALGERTLGRAEWVFDFSFPKAQGHPNPHLWLNVAYAMKYVELIRDQLGARDPARQAWYQTNASRLLADLTRLDRCIATAVDTIPAAQRKLLTYHDSWPYFARRYGMAVVGAIQPASFADPSPREVARIIDQLRKEKVPAIFGSEVFPSKVLEKIAREAQVRYITSLRDDALPGAPGDPHHSYIGMMVANVTTMVSALGGVSSAFENCVQNPSAR
jgi:manganese/iron transport system substrate-binding protein